MKKIVSKFLSEIGCSCEYSGKTQTLFINDPLKTMRHVSAEEMVINKYGYSLPFRLQTNE